MRILIRFCTLTALTVATAAALPVPAEAKSDLRFAQVQDVKPGEEPPGRLPGLRQPRSPEQREARQQRVQECLAQLPPAERAELQRNLQDRRMARRDQRRQAMASLSPEQREQLRADRRRLAAGPTAEQRERFMAERAARRAQRQGLTPQDRCARVIQRLRDQTR